MFTPKAIQKKILLLYYFVTRLTSFDNIVILLCPSYATASLFNVHQSGTLKMTNLLSLQYLKTKTALKLFFSSRRFEKESVYCSSSS